MRWPVLGLVLLGGCSSPTAPPPPPTTTTTLAPSPTPTPVVMVCPALDHIKTYIHADHGTRVIIDSTPFFNVAGKGVVPCNNEHDNCGVIPANACEDPRGQVWSRISGSFAWELNCGSQAESRRVSSEPGCPESAFQIKVFTPNPGVSVFEACPRIDAPAHYAGAGCGRVTVRVQ